MTKPYEDAVLFAEGYDLQEQMMNLCYTALLKSALRLQWIDLSTPIVWDNKLFFGVGSFPDDLDRYKLMGEAERHFSLAMKFSGLHFISFFRAYSIKDYFRLQTELGKLYVQYAFPTLFASGMQSINGVSIQKKTAMIRSFSSTFVLYADGAKCLKTYARPSLKALRKRNSAVFKFKESVVLAPGRLL